MNRCKLNMCFGCVRVDGMLKYLFGRTLTFPFYGKWGMVVEEWGWDSVCGDENFEWGGWENQLKIFIYYN